MFCATYNLKDLIREPLCFKSLENPTCANLILKNRLKCFQNSNVFETGLSDFHKLTFTVLKAYFQRQKPKVIKYRNHKRIDNSLFRNDLLNELLSKNVQTKHLDSFKGELHSNDIFLHFALIGLECDSITLFTKINFFCLLKLTLQHHLHKIYMAFYLLT